MTKEIDDIYEGISGGTSMKIRKKKKRKEML